jgi:transposase-like protein
MEDESKTVDGRRRWQSWTEQEARAALDELSRSGVSVAKLAEARGVSVQRIFYWRKRLAEEAPVKFVPVAVSTSGTSPAMGSHIEIVAGPVTLRVRGDGRESRMSSVSSSPWDYLRPAELKAIKEIGHRPCSVASLCS